MGTNVDAIARFFEQKMQAHDLVESCSRLPSDDGYYIYSIERRNGLPRVTVYVSDAYSYGFADFASRPAEIGSGDFIVVNQFGPEIPADVVEHARKAQIGLGIVGKLMGALNSREIWKYRSPAEKQASPKAR